MTINFTDLFTRIGLFSNAGNTIQAALRDSAQSEVEDALQGLAATLPIEYEAVRQNVLTGLRSLQSANSAALESCVCEPIRQLIRTVVALDNPQASDDISTALVELAAQMVANSESIKATAIGLTPSYSAGNTGDGVIIASSKRSDGKTNAHIFAESIEMTADGAGSFFAAGEAAQTDLLAYDWPRGSGAGGSLTVHGADSADNLLTNFENANDQEPHLPDGWLATPATFGSTLKLTDVEVQTVAISSDPSAGWYTLSWTNASGDVQTTEPLAYNATQAEVEDALRSLAGLSLVEVSTAGTSPNVTHTITLLGVTNPAELTSTNNTTGGSIAHATIVAGSGNVMRGARALEFDSDGAELTAIYFPLTGRLATSTQYAVNLWAIVDSVPAAGALTVDLVDGIGGTTVADTEGTDNSFTIDATAISDSNWTAYGADFRTPSDLQTVYLRIRISTAISNTSSVFPDDVSLVPMSLLYAGGPSFAVFRGPTDWLPGDRITVAATTNQTDTANGAIHRWINRAVNLQGTGRLMPTADSPTQADSLIA